MAHQYSILVVDYEPLVRKVLSTLLIKEDFKVEEAENGHGAYMKLLDGKKRGFVFDCLILDVEMPGSIDGRGLLKLLKGPHSTFKNLPVIMYTAVRSKNDIVYLIENLGADDYIVKSDEFNPNVLLSKIKKLIHDRKGESAKAESLPAKERAYLEIGTKFKFVPILERLTKLMAYVDQDPSASQIALEAIETMKGLLTVQCPSCQNKVMLTEKSNFCMKCRTPLRG